MKRCDVCGAPARSEVRFRTGSRWWPYCARHLTKRRSHHIPWDADKITDIRPIGD